MRLRLRMFVRGSVRGGPGVAKLAAVPRSRIRKRARRRHRHRRRPLRPWPPLGRAAQADTATALYSSDVPSAACGCGWRYWCGCCCICWCGCWCACEWPVGDNGAAGGAPPPPPPNDLDEDIVFDRAVMADLRVVESWLGRPFDVPDQIPGDQINELAAVAQAIRTGHWRANSVQMEFATATAAVPDKRDDWRAHLLTPLEAELFGRRTRLGMGRAELHFDISATRVDPDDPDQTWLTIVPHGASVQEIEASELRHLAPGKDWTDHC